MEWYETSDTDPIPISTPFHGPKMSQNVPKSLCKSQDSHPRLTHGVLNILGPYQVFLSYLSHIPCLIPWNNYFEGMKSRYSMVFHGNISANSCQPIHCTLLLQGRVPNGKSPTSCEWLEIRLPSFNGKIINRDSHCLLQNLKIEITLFRNPLSKSITQLGKSWRWNTIVSFENQRVPSGNLTQLLKIAIYSEFSH